MWVNRDDIERMIHTELLKQRPRVNVVLRQEKAGVTKMGSAGTFSMKRVPPVGSRIYLPQDSEGTVRFGTVAEAQDHVDGVHSDALVIADLWK